MEFLRLLQAAACARRLVLLALASAALAKPASAQPAFPNHTVRVVIPWTAGGPGDTVARTIAQGMQDLLKQAVVVDSKAGANGIIAATEVSRAPKDGYTLLFSDESALSLNGFLFTTLPYKPDTDFVAVSRVAQGSMVLAVPPDSPYKTLDAFFAAVKANPGKFSYATAGVGSTPHLAIASMLREKGLEMTHVPYKGASAAVQDVIAGRVQLTALGVPLMAPMVNAGKLKALAISGPRRTPLLPEVMTLRELGLPEHEASYYFGFVAPAGTPPDVVNTVARAIRTVVTSEDFKSKASTLWSMDVVDENPQQFASFLLRDRERSKERVARSGAKLD